jgi:CheY-like chemotaxis protein
MTTPLKILVIEDVEADFLLLKRNLHHQGSDIQSRRIDSNIELEQALKEKWDIVLSDYNVPGMDFRTSLHRIQKSDPELPVILVSGSVGEETAVELLLLGLTDLS